MPLLMQPDWDTRTDIHTTIIIRITVDTWVMVLHQKGNDVIARSSPKNNWYAMIFLDDERLLNH